ncbi:hypothetical protein [Ralstonia chuxiongensis]|uniref:hypothetical protein n=1 Tax=Ralstonia chuxiongensis TaxID=2957504 RepID=UPI002931F3FF|nr:hypothetical protein [Ralstonia chuxiongensis]
MTRIVIDGDGMTHVLSKTNEEISFDRSVDENQIFSSPLIAGLAEVSKVQAPPGVGHPLCRWDSKHRANIMSFWICNKSRQVILPLQKGKLMLTSISAS